MRVLVCMVIALFLANFSFGQSNDNSMDLLLEPGESEYVFNSSKAISYHDDEGNLKQVGIFTEGERDQNWQTWYPNGQLQAKAQFDMGMKTGTWFVYDEHGQLRYEIEYKENKLQGAKAWNAQGELVAVK